MLNLTKLTKLIQRDKLKFKFHSYDLSIFLKLKQLIHIGFVWEFREEGKEMNTLKGWQIYEKIEKKFIVKFLEEYFRKE